MDNQVAKIPVSLALLEQMLPAGTKILAADFSKAFGVVEVLVSHPSFEELNDGDSIPTKTLLAHRKYCELGNHSHVTKVEYA